MVAPVKQQRPLGYHRHVSLFTLVVCAINVSLYAIMLTYNQRLDVTHTKQFTLTSQSVKLLQTLRQPVKVIGSFRPDDPDRKQFEDLLKQYRRHSYYVAYEVIDPDRQPELAKRYHVQDRQTIVMAGNGKKENVSRLKEQALTNALFKLLREKKKGIYFTTGHGEPSLIDTKRDGYSFARQRLQEQNYDVKEFVLTRHEQLPADAAVVVIAGLRTDLSESEIRILGTYLESGGRILAMIDPGATSNLSLFLARYGIALGNDWVIETSALGRLFGGDYHMPAVMASTAHPITKDLGGAMIIFPVVRSVHIASPLPSGIDARTLMSTSPQSWADTDLNGLQRSFSSFDEGRDQKGPISIAVVAVIPARQAEDKDGRPVPAARLIVIGDSEFATNHFITLRGNNDFFINMVRWLAEAEALVAIQSPVGEHRTPIARATAHELLIFWLPVVLLPLTVFACGIIVCRRWRRQRVIST